MIFLTTENILEIFKIPFSLSIENGRKHLVLIVSSDINVGLVSNIEMALNSRMSGDSINYELSISKAITKDYSSIDSDVRSLLHFLIFESGLVCCTFENERDDKKTLEIKAAIVKQLKESTTYNELLIAVCALDSIFRNNSTLALELCSYIKNETNLNLAINSIILFQSSRIDESIKRLDQVDVSNPQSPFLHLCKNLKAFICIQDGRHNLFKALTDDLSLLEKKEISHLAPIINSNMLYLSNYVDERLWNTEGHYKNVLLYHKSRELDLLDNLKTSTQRMVTNEAYENVDVYGKDTVRFNNTPGFVSKKMSRFIFLNSFMGSNAGFLEGCNLLLRAFFSFADMYKDQSLYKEALRNAIHIGSQKDIEKIIRIPSFIKDSSAISYFEKLILGNPYKGATAIGVSYLIKNIYPFINEQSAPSIVSHLKNEIQGEFSFTSSFDHVRPALEALYFVLHTIPKTHGLELFNEFVKVVDSIPMNMIGLDSINKVVNNLPEELIQSDPSSTNNLIDFYFKNIEVTLKMHYEMTLLSLSVLVRNSNVKSYKDSFLKIIKEELSKHSTNENRKIFLLDRIREMEKILSDALSADLGKIVVDNILSPSSDNYSTESFGGFDSLLISTNSFNTMPKETQDSYLDKLFHSLFDSKSSISNKTRILKAIAFLSEKIEPRYFSQLDNYISNNRVNLFASTKTENRSPFLSDSFVNFRALLFSCASMAPVKKPVSFSLDLLRLSVSTESRVRELFTEAAVNFIQSNPKCSGNLTLLNRCYELTFDVDPKVRGQAISSILELGDVIDEEIKETYLLRISDLSSDPSEISRAYLALALNRFRTKVSSEFFINLKNKLEKDVSFYVRRNINKADEQQI